MKRFLLSIIGILTFAIGMNAETYTHTFKDKELDENGGKASLSGIEWTSSKASITWNKEKGIQLGSKSAVCPSFSLTTSAFKDYTIKKAITHFVLDDHPHAVDITKEIIEDEISSYMDLLHYKNKGEIVYNIVFFN